MSEKRTLQTVQMEIAELTQRLGILHYQSEREVPREMEKIHNQLFDLDKEGMKLFKEQKELQTEAQKAAAESANQNAEALSTVATTSEPSALETVLEVVK